MAETVGSLPLLAGLPVFTSAAPPTQPTIELAQPPPAALLFASTITGIVLGRNGDGALLLRTDLGTLALKTLLALVPGSQVDLRLIPGPPPAVVLLHTEEPVPLGTPPSNGGALSTPGENA